MILKDLKQMQKVHEAAHAFEPFWCPSWHTGILWFSIHVHEDPVQEEDDAEVASSSRRG